MSLYLCAYMYQPGSAGIGTHIYLQPVRADDMIDKWRPFIRASRATESLRRPDLRGVSIRFIRSIFGLHWLRFSC